ncbi:MAG: hypothetical protein ACRDUY_09610 [Nitriliruptorales bacterium]
MARFRVREDEHPGNARTMYTVVDTQEDDLPVARFDQRHAAEVHAAKLNAGPLDWDEQEAWKDEWADDD